MLVCVCELNSGTSWLDYRPELCGRAPAEDVAKEWWMDSGKCGGQGGGKSLSSSSSLPKFGATVATRNLGNRADGEGSFTSTVHSVCNEGKTRWLHLSATFSQSPFSRHCPPEVNPFQRRPSAVARFTPSYT